MADKNPVLTGAELVDWDEPEDQRRDDDENDFIMEDRGRLEFFYRHEPYFVESATGPGGPSR